MVGPPLLVTSTPVEVVVGEPGGEKPAEEGEEALELIDVGTCVCVCVGRGSLEVVVGERSLWRKGRRHWSLLMLVRVCVLGGGMYN